MVGSVGDQGIGERPMMAGHFGLAATVKATAPRTPLWALMLATQLLDVLFVVLLLSGGIEDLKVVTDGTYGENLIHAYWTHSLVGAVLIAVAFGLFGAWRWGQRSGLILGAVVFSHWLLDLLMHRPDLPILPGNLGDLPLLGLGLWRTPWASLTAELVLVVLGAVTYFRSVRGRATNPRRGIIAGGVMAVLLAVNLAVDALA
jgi:hypothetical protein